MIRYTASEASTDFLLKIAIRAKSSSTSLRAIILDEANRIRLRIKFVVLLIWVTYLETASARWVFRLKV
jgi:hypothetical protein